LSKKFKREIFGLIRRGGTDDARIIFDSVKKTGGEEEIKGRVGNRVGFKTQKPETQGWTKKIKKGRDGN